MSDVTGNHLDHPGVDADAILRLVDTSAEPAAEALLEAGRALRASAYPGQRVVRSLVAQLDRAQAYLALLDAVHARAEAAQGLVEKLLHTDEGAPAEPALAISLLCVVDDVACLAFAMAGVRASSLGQKPTELEFDLEGEIDSLLAFTTAQLDELVDQPLRRRLAHALAQVPVKHLPATLLVPLDSDEEDGWVLDLVTERLANEELRQFPDYARQPARWRVVRRDEAMEGHGGTNNDGVRAMLVGDGCRVLVYEDAAHRLGAVLAESRVTEAADLVWRVGEEVRRARFVPNEIDVPECSDLEGLLQADAVMVEAGGMSWVLSFATE